VASAEAYLQLHAKFHLDPSNRLATVHQRRRQTDRQNNGPMAYGERVPFYKRPPKNETYVNDSDKNSSGDEIANVNFYAVRP